MVEVVGGDRAKPSRQSKDGVCVVMVGRGEDGSKEKRAAFVERKKNGTRGVFWGKTSSMEGVHLDGNDMFIHKSDDISSTRVRRALEKKDAQQVAEALRVLVKEGVLISEVAEYMIANWDNLFEENG